MTKQYNFHLGTEKVGDVLWLLTQNRVRWWVDNRGATAVVSFFGDEKDAKQVWDVLKSQK